MTENVLYWFYAYREDRAHDKNPHFRAPGLHGIKLGHTTRLTPAERMRRYSRIYSFEGRHLEAVNIDGWLDLRKIETACHNRLALNWPRMNARLRPAEIFDLGKDSWEDAVIHVRWMIDDLMTGIRYGLEGSWNCITDA
jgi:hypothetical protein